MTTDDLDNSVPRLGRPALPRPARGSTRSTATGGSTRSGRSSPSRTAASRRSPISRTPDWFEIVSPAATPRLPVTGAIRVPRAESGDLRPRVRPGCRAARRRVRARGERCRLRAARRERSVSWTSRSCRSPSGPAPATREDRDRYSVTVRLRVTDDRGLVGESRRSFFVLDDPSWMEHFPWTSASPARPPRSSPTSTATAGTRSSSRRRMERFESSDGRASEIREQKRASRSRGDHDPRAGRRGHPRARRAGDRRGLARGEGLRVQRTGRSPEGIPGVDPPRACLNPQRRRRSWSAESSRSPWSRIWTESAAKRSSSPRSTATVYAWRGDGKPLPGFPWSSWIKRTGRRSKIVSSPAVGDIDGDGRPEIVFGSNGVWKGLAAAFAVHADGNLHQGGPFLPGGTRSRFPSCATCSCPRSPPACR